ncbi:uncharacterized protein LOC113416407 [Notechis scutatus]|uniref:Uncharacterized protein LOC113416407 n=1 Tax=Notechis scutatus TaxID=8663 RepID=A0A6J1UI88_9SAUR|nr:uncharacterized protein LOC113416407 [Notechis scutatus]
MVLWERIEKILKTATQNTARNDKFHNNYSEDWEETRSRNSYTIPIYTKIYRRNVHNRQNNLCDDAQTMQATLLSIQETMIKLQENMTRNHEEMKIEMEEVKRLQMIEKRTEKTEQKLESVDQKMKEQNKEVENTLIQLEMERASFYLRFQNVEETKEEDLTAIMAEIITEALQRGKSEIINELDVVYRVYTNYARRFRLSKEVHIRFAREKKAKDIIYKITRDEPMSYRGKEIIMLKQIPKRVCEQEKEYRFQPLDLIKITHCLDG